VIDRRQPLCVGLPRTTNPLLLRRFV
jgi:hypothetical protein